MILLDAVVVWREEGPEEGAGGGRVARTTFLVMASLRTDGDACDCD